MLLDGDISASGLSANSRGNRQTTVRAGRGPKLMISPPVDVEPCF